MSTFRRPTSDEAAFIKTILEEVQRRSPRASNIPVLQVDPVETDPTNLWMRNDGRLRGRYWNGASWTYVDYPLRGDITAPPAVPAAPAFPGYPAAPVTYKKTYTATWTQTYKGDGTKRTDTIGEEMVAYGNEPGSLYGTQRALIGFDYATIAADLASSTIYGVQLELTNIEAYWASGVYIYFGMHNVTAEPATWPADADLPMRRVANAKWGKPQTRSINLPLLFGQRLRAGTGKGIAVEAPSDSRDYYGYAAGVGSGYNEPKLVINYTK